MVYIKDLELKLHLWEKAYSARQELEDLTLGFRSLGDGLMEIDKAKKSIFIELRGHQERLRKVLAVQRQLRQWYGKIKKNLAELEGNLRRVDDELVHLKESRRTILERKRSMEMAILKEKEQALVERLRATAKEKRVKGQNLSWNELKVMFGEGPDEPLD